MKAYKVLEAHQGDKAYAVGDTRVADPNAVDHLVKLGLLEEIGEAPLAPVERSEADMLREQIETLTRERDEARDAVAPLQERADAAERDLAAAREQIETLKKDAAAEPAAAAKAKAAN